MNKEKTIKVLKTVGNVFLWLFVAFAVVTTVFAFLAQQSDKGVPAINGKCFLTVQSDSMYPTFKKGDLLIGHVPTNDELDMIKPGDVITYKADLNGDGQKNELNSHRVTRVLESGYFKTKGDNAETNPIEDSFAVAPLEVISVWHDGEGKLSGVGSAIDFLQSSTGFLVCIVIPLILFFLYELYRFIVVVLSIRNQGKKVISASDEELIKQRAIEEYLKKQAEAQASAAPPADNGEEKKE